MTDPDFKEFFKQVAGGQKEHEPYPYQKRLAGAAEDNKGGRSCESLLIDIPTGMGKTAAVVMAWLWNRVILQRPDWPRRLVYCLPMRTLVEQTRDNVEEWLEQADDWCCCDRTKWLKKNSPVILMGGEKCDPDHEEWDLYPEKEAILIGTQDMLLSRALNRGYGMSRYRWPMHFGLLNNDCLWVLDETQLMGVGVSTATQLEAFRRSNFAATPTGFDSLSGKVGSVSWYMSATNNPGQLQTREWRGCERSDEFSFTLTDDEKSAESGPVYERRLAKKKIRLRQSEILSEMLVDILKKHRELVGAIGENPGVPLRTLVICNTVDRACELHALLQSHFPEGCELLLMHSRFRPPERHHHVARLEAISDDKFYSKYPDGQIVVATQVIEAGVDISSGVLWTEVAPLASLVQRLGRLNRAGEFNESSWEPVAMIAGIGTQPTPSGKESAPDREKREAGNRKCCLPYGSQGCEQAWKALGKLKGNASPASLEQIRPEIADSIPHSPYSLRKHELIDFFDTDANLSLGFTDVSPFVRGLDTDTDVYVLWREWPDSDKGAAPPGWPDVQRDELCPVPFSKAKDATQILNRGWIWRGRDSGWMRVSDSGISPGMTIHLPVSAGGYDTSTGWTGVKENCHHDSHYVEPADPSGEDQLSCLNNGWRTIEKHTLEVETELEDILVSLGTLISETEKIALLNAVPWHDIGKNHHAWQEAVVIALEKAGIANKESFRPFAKFSLSESPSLDELDGTVFKRRVRELRKSFRPRVTHEVASALAFRQSEQNKHGTNRGDDLSSLLSEFIIMSHHGRVRKVLRDEIPKIPKTKKDMKVVRGVADGNEIPAVSIAGQLFGCDSLSTDCRRMGRSPEGYESYTRGVLRLLEHYGPFRLACFEALFRAADIRASKLASKTP